ncbi:hypothetical protein HII31_08041 [Pseudocercospora fuligena]|uniref:Uncharacterized protein n=1 Tax=Pseudocercospora fuligena TaxID=685502 RepID=A0A8H6RHW7_9PEZI|nr:hypothetical protein HII31_08041 [Pseudocercospora fuligena]
MRFGTTFIAPLRLDCDTIVPAGPATSLDLEAPTQILSFQQIADATLPKHPTFLKGKQAPAPEVYGGTKDIKRPRLTNIGIAKPVTRMPPPAFKPKLILKNTKNAAKGGFKLTIKGKKAQGAPSTGKAESTNISSSYPPPPPFPFLSLPSEMRNDVYKILLTHDKAADLRAEPAILRANRQIHDEASGFIYSESIATIKISGSYMGGVVVSGDVVDNLHNSRSKVPLANDPTSAFDFDDPTKKYSALWPAYLKKIPKLSLEIHFDDANPAVDTTNSTWFASDLSATNRCLYSLVSYLMTGQATNISTKISGRVPELNIKIHATELENPNLARAWEILLYPLTKIPKIYKLTTNIPSELNNIPDARSSPTPPPETSYNLLANWPTLRSLATISLNLTPYFGKPSTSYESRTRYSSTLLATATTSSSILLAQSEAVHFQNLLTMGRDIFNTIKFAIEDKACIFDRRADIRMMGLMGTLAECVLTLRGFDDHVTAPQPGHVAGSKSMEKPSEALARVKGLYDLVVGEKSPL